MRMGIMDITTTNTKVINNLYGAYWALFRKTTKTSNYNEIV